MTTHLRDRPILAGLLILLTVAAACSPTPPTPYVPPPVSGGGPAFPTQLPRIELGGSDQVMTMRLPGKIDALDLAVHPISGWPAVIAWQHWSLSTDGVAAFARIYNPKARRWGPALQVDLGPTGNGADRFASAVIGITGDSAVHAVWGASDEGSAGLWTSTSTDYGETWSAAQRIATDCWFANAMATTPSGWIVVQASCFTGGRADPQPDATLIVRREDGTWLPQQRSGVPGWFGTVAIAGDGPDALATAFVTSHGAGQDNHVAYLVSKYLRNEGGWNVTTRRIVPLGIAEAEAGDYHWHPQSLAYPRHYADGSVRTGITFMWSGRRRASAYALSSFDGGLSWGSVEPIIYYVGNSDETGQILEHVVPAYDVAADRLVAIWSGFGDPADLAPNTHYSSWSVPGSGVWHSSLQALSSDPGDIAPGQPVPIAFGGRSVGDMAATLASNARKMWIGWVEQRQEVKVRSFELNQMIPISEYPVGMSGP